MRRKISPSLASWIDAHRAIVQPFAISGLIDIFTAEAAPDETVPVTEPIDFEMMRGALMQRFAQGHDSLEQLVKFGDAGFEAQWEFMRRLAAGKLLLATRASAKTSPSEAALPSRSATSPFPDPGTPE